MSDKKYIPPELLETLRRICNNAEARYWNTEEDATRDACKAIMNECKSVIAGLEEKE